VCVREREREYVCYVCDTCSSFHCIFFLGERVLLAFCIDGTLHGHLDIILAVLNRLCSVFLRRSALLCFCLAEEARQDDGDWAGQARAEAFSHGAARKVDGARGYCFSQMCIYIKGLCLQKIVI
jgi:hypothetical protein